MVSRAHRGIGVRVNALKMISYHENFIHKGNNTHKRFKLIHSVDSKFVEFCIHNACNCGNLSLRGTFFFVLGLFSRTMKGSAKLNQLQWEGRSDLFPLESLTL